MTYAAISLPLGREKCQTFEDLLAHYRLDTLPKAAVRAQKRYELHACRPGMLRIIGPMVAWSLRVFPFLTIIHIIDEIQVKSDKVPDWLLQAVEWLTFFVVCVGIIGAGVNTFWFSIAPWWVILGMLTPGIAYVASILLAFASAGMGQAASWWTRMPMVRGANGHLYRTWDMPGHIYARAEIAANIPDVRLAVDRLGGDPYLVAMRGRWPFQQVAYLGAWETGNPDLDNF